MPAGAKKILDLATNEVEGVRFQLPKDKGGDKGLPREQKFLVKPSIIVFAVVLELPDINQMAVYDFVGTLQELAFGDSADAHRYTGDVFCHILLDNVDHRHFLVVLVHDNFSFLGASAPTPHLFF